MAKPVVFAMEFTADTSDLKSLGTVESDLKGIAKAASGASEELDTLSDTDIDIDINDQAIENARDRIRELQREISDAKSMDINADVSKAKKQISSLESDIKALQRRPNKIPVTVDPSRVRQGLAGLKDEAAQSGREAGASFSGGFSGVVDFGQEVFSQALVGFGAVGAAAGLTAAVGIGIVTSEIEEANAATEQWAETFRQLAKDGARGAEAITGVMDAMTTGETAQIAKDLEAAGVSARDFYTALADPNGSVAASVREQIGAGQVLGGMNVLWDEGARASTRLYEVITRSATGFNDAAAATEASEDATRGMTTATEDAATAQDALNEGLQEAEEWLSRAKVAVNDYFSALGQGTADQDSYTESLYRLADSVKENGKSFTGNSEAALENRDAMRQVASQAGGLLKSMADAGATSDQLKTKTKALRDQFVAQATKILGSKKAAEELADQYGLVPDEVSTAITQSGMTTAQQQVDNYNASLDEADRTVTTIWKLRVAANDRRLLENGINDLALAAQTTLRLVPPPPPTPAAPPAPPVRVYIAGREVEATIQGSMARARESESLYGLMGFGPKRFRGV